MHGRYPDHDVLAHAGHWDPVTRAVVRSRVVDVPSRRFFSKPEFRCLCAFCDVVLAQDAEPRVPVMSFVDAKLAAGQLDGFQHDGMPDDRDTWRQVAHGLDQAARQHGETTFAQADEPIQRKIVGAFADGSLNGQIWDRLPAKTAWTVVMRSVLSAFYSHPWTWNEIGFGGPAYPRGYMRLAEGPRAPSPTKPPKRSDSIPSRTSNGEGCHEDPVKRLAKGAVGPVGNDSRFLLDVHSRGLPGRATMAATATRMRSTC